MILLRGAALACVALLGIVLAAPPALSRPDTGLPPLAPHVRLLDMHPLDPKKEDASKAPATIMPQIARPGGLSDPMQISIAPPAAAQPGENQDLAASPERSGTGFFIGDGTVLTAAHVVNGCRRVQVISDHVSRTWVSVGAADPARDVAVLRSPGLHAPGILRIGTSPPASGKLRVAGFPASGNGTTPKVAPAVTVNQKFPAGVGSLANPRDTLWLSAPGVTNGFSGGPIFDPRTGTAVGMIRGAVDGGYLRLIRDLPTVGVATGPGIGEIGAFLRRDAPYALMSLASSVGEAGDETLRRATVRVLCWQ